MKCGNWNKDYGPGVVFHLEYDDMIILQESDCNEPHQRHLLDQAG